MANSSLDQFCGSPFWDSDLTWNTDYPLLTPCFEKTVLAGIPTLFIWLFFPLDFYQIHTSTTSDIPWGWRNILKLVMSAVLLLICCTDLVYILILHLQSHPVLHVDIYTPIIRIFAIVTYVGLVLWHRQKGIRSSGLVFIFWSLVVLLGIPQFITAIRTNLSEGQVDLLTYTYIIYYMLSIIVLVLNFFGDLEPRYSKYPPVENPSPEVGSSFPSRIIFSWFDSMASLGYNRPLTNSDLWSMKYEDKASEIISVFNHHWKKTVRKSTSKAITKYEVDKPVIYKSPDNLEVSFHDSTNKLKEKSSSILPAICLSFGTTFLVGAVEKLLNDVLAFLSPFLLKLLIEFVSGKEPWWRGYFYSLLLFIVTTLQVLTLSQYFNKMMLIGLRIRTVLISAIYRKALKLSNSARKESTVGEIVNLMSVDAQRFIDLMEFINMVWSAPLQISLALYFLWQILGPSVLAGLAVMIMLIPINGFIANQTKKLQIKQMTNKDERVKMMSEILSGIKVLKLYAWESSFEQQELNIRNKEVNVLKQYIYWNLANNFVWACAPYLVALVTFAVYVMADEKNVLDAKTAFVSLSLFNLMRFPLSVLPMVITSLIQASVSTKRINKFMNSEELEPDTVSHDENSDAALVMEKCTFRWDSEDQEAVLKNISLQIKHGMLVGIVGAVGSGKSSLLAAFLGELEKVSGAVNTRGSIAYIPQVAWIQNCTLKDNILFGKQFDKRRYNKTIEACALKPDLEMLPGGDQTEIGEKGINLSGGQKQRVSLARAVYYNSDVYFFDDPLSAVDSHVGKHLFEKVIGPKGLLYNKTRLFVTHNITYLPEVDLIVVLKNGEISEMGTYKELLETKGGSFSEFLATYLQETDDLELQDLDDNLKKQLRDSNPELYRQRSDDSITRRRSSEISHTQEESNPATEGIEKLIEEEKQEVGGVKWQVYSHYLRNIGFLLAIITILLGIIFQSFSIGSNVWLSKWSSDTSTVVNGTQDTNKRNFYLKIYGILGVGQSVAVLFRDICPRLGCWFAACALHNSLLHGIIRAPLSFFDVTPSGRILTRFARDIDTLDTRLPSLIEDGVHCSFEVLATIVVISYTTPIFMVAIIPIGILYYFIQRYYVSTSRQLERLEAVTRSPIYSHFGESIAGSMTIRAYKVQNRFVKESEQKVDYNQVCTYPGIISSSWLAIRLATVGNLIVFFSALFSVIGRDKMNAGLVGLSVSYALQITETFNWLVRVTAGVETNIVAVERIKEYSETTQEAPWEITPNIVSPKWPEEGKVEFRNLKIRYREGLEPVLKGISFVINGGEKVGIVGRTGAGKSSLTLGLFRIVEAAGGTILIDGVDISKLGLHALRSRITIIPQDPVLFSGNLRMNLDPFEKYTDEQVWRSLELAHLKNFVSSLAGGLLHEVNEGGENLSLGQRQLICLARALLRKTKVLVLDEATAAVDLETDDLIQSTIRTEFKNCTILTIAHRINTIMDSDRVLVLDKGEISEFNSPELLLGNKDSLFYSLAKDAGLVQ